MNHHMSEMPFGYRNAVDSWLRENCRFAELLDRCWKIIHSAVSPRSCLLCFCCSSLKSGVTIFRKFPYYDTISALPLSRIIQWNIPHPWKLNCERTYFLASFEFELHGYLQKTISISLYSSFNAFLEINDTVPFSRIAARGFSFLFIMQLSQPGIGSLKASVSPPLQRPNYFATLPAEIFIEILQDLDFVQRQHLRRVCKWWELLSRLPRMLENVHIDVRPIGLPGSSCECASPFLGRLMTAAWSGRQPWTNIAGANAGVRTLICQGFGAASLFGERLFYYDQDLHTRSHTLTGLIELFPDLSTLRLLQVNIEGRYEYSTCAAKMQNDHPALRITLSDCLVRDKLQPFGILDRIKFEETGQRARDAGSFVCNLLIFFRWILRFSVLYSEHYFDFWYTFDKKCLFQFDLTWRFEFWSIEWL